MAMPMECPPPTVEDVLDNSAVIMMDDMSPELCWDLLNDLVTSLLDILGAGGAATGPNLARIIRVLLRTALNARHAGEARLVFFLSRDDTRRLVGQLAGFSDEAGGSDVIAAMIAAVEEPGVGGDDFIRVGGKLARMWLAADDSRGGVDVLPTRAGFTLEVFALIDQCAQRQKEVCGEKRVSMRKLDRDLAPLVQASVVMETELSINMADEAGLTALHHAANVSNLPMTTEAILSHPAINVNALRGNTLSTPLLGLLAPNCALDDETLLIATMLLSRDDTDVSLKDILNKTALRMSIYHVDKKESDSGVALQIAKLILDHPTVTGEMMKIGVLKLIILNPPDSQAELYVQIMRGFMRDPGFTVHTDIGGVNLVDLCVAKLDDRKTELVSALGTLAALCEHPALDRPLLRKCFLAVIKLVNAGCSKVKQAIEVLTAIVKNEDFDVNEPLLDGQNAAQLATNAKVIDVMEAVGRKRNFNPNVTDNMGNTVLYQICRNFSSSRVIRFLTSADITWDYGSTNLVRQTACDFYRELHDPDPVLQKLLGGMGVAAPRIAALPEQSGRQVKTLPARPISWTSVPVLQSTVNIQSSTQEFYNDMEPEILSEMAYPMGKARKGKACILSLPRFEVDWLKPLDGYQHDKSQLADLLAKIGFDIMAPQHYGDYYLTAEELKTAVGEFAGKLDEEDQCAVLCVMSHGKEGTVYGVDGRPVTVKHLLEKLNNVECPQMAGKPKVVIIQTCQGGMPDYGLFVRAGPSSPLVDTSVPHRVSMPAMSDMIICKPAMPEYVSFVRTEDGGGSFYIESLVKTLSEHVHEESLHTILTWVNQSVSERSALCPNQTADHAELQKQMCHFDSCMTKDLFFLPCPGGMRGSDWTVVDQQEDLISFA